MATNFPGSLDSLTNPTSTDGLDSPSHSSQHINANDAVEALEKVSVGPLVYNVKGYGAAGDDSTDDTSAIQSAIDAAIAAGGGVVVFPEGTYVTTTALTLDNASNVVLQGVGRATIKNSTTAVITAIAAGDPFVSGNLTYYDLTGTHNRGDSVLNFATAAEAGNFSAGDVIWIRTRQLLGSGSDQPIAEMNKVVSSDNTAGTVTLEWPLAKEYTDDGTNPYGVAVADQVGERNAIRGLRIEATAQRALNLDGQLWFTVEDCEFAGISFILVRGRFLTFRGNRGHLSPAWGTLRPTYMSLDKGTCDVVHQGNYWSSEGHGIVHIHEGIANVLSIGNTYLQGESDSGTAENWPVISIRATAWDIRLLGETLINSPRGDGIETHDSSAYPGVGLGTNGLLISGLTLIGTMLTHGVQGGTGTNGAVIGNRLTATAGSDILNLGDTDYIVAENEFNGSLTLASGVVRGRNRGGGDFLDEAHTWSAEQTFNGNAFAETDVSNTWSALQTLADAVNIALGTTTGTQIGTAATQKLGFFGVTPVAQQASTADLKDVLVALGFLPDSGATPLNLDGATLDAARARLEDGSESSPALTWDGDTDTGLYHTTGNIYAATQGVTRMVFDSNGLVFIPNKTNFHWRFNGANGQIQFADGAGSAWDTNLYRSSANVLKTDDSFHVALDFSHLGSNAGFFGATPTTQPTALTAADASTVDTTYGQEEADVINNLRTRVNELETKLQALGLLA